MKYSKDKLLSFYRMMQTIRLFESHISDLYARGIVPGLAHLYIGEEAVATAVCAALRQDDYITSTHRGHGHVIAKGAELKLMMAELFGRRTGYCKGKGGSMHIADMNAGILGANGIAGGGLPIAVGAGWSAKWRKTDQVTACFFGDGSSNNGTFHESLNLASLHRLPVIFVCENNLYGISVCQIKHQLITDIAVRASSYNMPGVIVDGNDVLKVHEATVKAVERARSGEGPTLIECKTYR
jgi:TPP-dependent pyruvate/acetoin dehydrogenase alpha subunit